MPTEYSGLFYIIAWFAWAIACTFGLRLALSYAGRTMFDFNEHLMRFAAYPAMVVILIASYYLHGAVLGPMEMYGGRLGGWSLIAYLLAPFGLPLFVGLLPNLLIDLTRSILKGAH